MRRLLSALMLFTAAGSAQMRDLATTFDGGVIHFATDLRLAGTNDGPQGKIYKWENGKFSVVISPNATPLGFRSANAFGPVISDDGATLGYSFSAFVDFGEYVYAGAKIPAGGIARLSRNGRYALRGWNGGGTDAVLLNLAAGTEALQAKSVWGLTDSGSVLTQRGNSLYLGGRLGESVVATAPGKILGATTDATGSRVVYVTQHDGLLDLREGNNVLVSLNDTDTALRAELSSDGSRLLVIESIRNAAHAFWMDRNLPGRNELGPLRGATATISGNGRVVWLLETDGRLTRVKLDSGERESMSEALPTGLPASSSARGSLLRWEAPGLGEGPWLLNLVSQTARTSLRLPLLEAKADHVDFQIPWQLSDAFTNSWPGLQRPDGVFEVVGSLSLGPVLPQFWSDRRFYAILVPKFGLFPLVKAVHQGFDRQVTPDDPARAGELVHVYMSGLGPVAPVQADNIPATTPPAAITTPFTCAVDGIPARVLFAGLSVGLVGVYQVELEIPREPVRLPGVTCSVDTAQGGDLRISGYLPVAP